MRKEDKHQDQLVLCRQEMTGVSDVALQGFKGLPAPCDRGLSKVWVSSRADFETDGKVYFLLSKSCQLHSPTYPSADRRTPLSPPTPTVP